MRKTCLVTDPRFRLHDTGRGHPESPARLEALEAMFAEARYRDLPRIAVRAAEESEIAAVHSREHLAAVAASARRPHMHFDADTPVCDRSFEAALLAAGAAIEAADAIADGDFDNGFAALRPPGHHAEREHPMGFCLFNNVAVVARHLLARGMRRVLILDWDVHHGNGTHHTFYDDDRVMFVSLHQYPFYPGTGAADEIGSGTGAGYTVNVPMPAGAGNAEYFAAMRELIVPVAERFKPEFVLVSAGFDAHRDDPLAQIRLDAPAYGEFTHALSAVADAAAGGKMLLLLEGGYNLAALRDSVAAVLAAMAEPRKAELGAGELSGWGVEARRALSPYWKI